jgi:Asp-tRNA(Asn)/Glu-tRNA(Gln) amidotransferase A subunit family amidase
MTLNRRALLAFLATTSFANGILPATLSAQIQPGTRTITIDMVREAARLAGFVWTDQQCQELIDALSSFARHAEGIEKATLTNASPLPFQFDPRPPGSLQPALPSPLFRLDPAPRVRRPQNVESVAFWPLTHLAQLLESRQVTSVELTRMYLDRLSRHNARLNCVVTITDERALAEAAAADKAIASGKYLGLLHGIPYGVKDIIAAAGYPTRWGAPHLDHQRFTEDATVVQRLKTAGAVLVAKLTTGEMAFGDQWAGGRTNNPWNLAEGSSGSSAGSGAATAAGLVGFAIGTDTGGSILSPAVRNGIVGLRPTFGRVSRYGVMAAGTTLDKIGPMCRHAQDCAIVLRAIAGSDPGDLAAANYPVAFDAARGRYPKRIGYVPSMFEAEKDPDQRANNDRALVMLKRLGCSTHEISLPSGDLSYFIEYIERAAAFDSFTTAGMDGPLRARTSRFLRAGQLVSAVDYLQANRRRAVIMQDVARAMASLDAVMFTSLSLDSRTSLNPVMSLTGHPSIAVPNGLKSNGAPAGVMFAGHLYREGEVIALAKAWQETGQPIGSPPLFAAG